MKKIAALFLIIGSVVASCDSDVIEPAEGCDLIQTSYSTNVKAIIDQTCAYSGCHDGSGGIGPGDYTTYEGILRFLEDNSFGSRVITLKDNPSLGMPPDRSVYPESQQDDLSDTQLEIITCWLQEGFPQ